jgi:hypothetical protein
MTNVRTDEVLDALFQSAGLSSNQYSLARGSNTIAFLYYQKGTLMGDIIRKLMQAEMGNLFMDEQGIIRFMPRVILSQASVWQFDDDSIVSIRTLDANNIINVVQINATIREEQVKQPIWTLADTVSDEYVIAANSSKEIWTMLEDPATSVTAPTSGVSTSDSYFVATDSDGNAVGGVTVTGDDLFVDSYKMTLTNANAFPVRISEAVVWGTPAKIVDQINYVKRDTDSIDKYEERSISIDNDFVQSLEACDNLSLTILRAHAERDGDIQIEVKGSPSLQLGDIIEVDKDNFTGTYQISKIEGKVIRGKYEQIINATRYLPEDWFQLDVSLLDSDAVLTP